MFFFTVIISYYSQETLQIGFENPQEKINKCTCNFILSRVRVRQCSLALLLRRPTNCYGTSAFMWDKIDVYPISTTLFISAIY